MAKIIHLETSTKVCSVAISENGILIDSITEKSESFMHSEKLNFLLDELLKKNSFSFGDLNAVSVSSGPGSYTGIRIGVSTAKGLCFALNIPLISVDSLFALAGHFQNQDKFLAPVALIVAMIDARRMEAFTAIYDSFGYAVKPISAEIFTVDYLAHIHANIPVYLVGDAQEKCRQLWSQRENFVFTDCEASALGQVKLAFEKFQRAEFEDLAYFEPYYLKDFLVEKKIN